MIWINFPDEKNPPNSDWLARAEELTKQLKEAPDKPTRDKIIDKHSGLWSELKDWLGTFSHHKCWFSEARDTFSYMHVEHFRPKKRAKDPDRDGYWWRAFDYSNYRFCGGVGNVKKGSFFPLREHTSPALSPEDDCDDEAPLLIDPTRRDDVDLITFVCGRAFPAEKDGWRRKRAEISIERYNLNDHRPLERGRTQVWESCQLNVTRLAGLIDEDRRSHSPTRREQIRALKGKLIEMTRPESEYSAVARAFLLQDHRDWVRRLVVA